MKIRLIGSPDIVRAWGERLERDYGITGREYPCRDSNAEIRLYVDMDDRMAADIAGVDQGSNHQCLPTK